MKENREKKRAFSRRKEADGFVREGSLAPVKGILKKLPLEWQVLTTYVAGICHWSGRYLGLEWQVKEVTS
jgi:hypothetical protein